MRLKPRSHSLIRTTAALMSALAILLPANACAAVRPGVVRASTSQGIPPDRPSAYKSRITLTLDNTARVQGPVVQGLAAALRKGFVRAVSLKPIPTPSLSCSQGTWLLTEGDGTMSLMNNCPYKSINWGYRISPALVALTVGPVSENGPNWSKNSVGQARNAGHPDEMAGYFYHGTVPQRS